ncbi:DUF806 family protein, partial [Secundilactobacillus pentosiphilus]|uniref:DUF806 family protein n=1 Tax=Secundilactobacillus pentosiphilus TaxID=1714682 RepID=UPI0011AF0192
KAPACRGFSVLFNFQPLVKLFKAHRWALIQSKNHLIDPDTDQVSKVFYFDRSITLKEDK